MSSAGRSGFSVFLGGSLVALAVTACSSAGSSSAPAARPAPRPPAPARYGPGYSYYRSMMGRYPGSMMGGGMMGGGMPTMSRAGYVWMMGGAGAPGWMRGGHLPAALMGGRADPGEVMGRRWANAPGPRMSAARAAALASSVPAGARADRGRNMLVTTAREAQLTAVASPPGGKDETFRIAGMTNPRIVVPAGAHISLRLVNADPGTANGIVITAAGRPVTWMPMMTSHPAFAGAALWFLGEPTRAGMHAGVMSFVASAGGTYRYLCPVPGHAAKGMAGIITVR